jgi:hypothetical protein
MPGNVCVTLAAVIALATVSLTGCSHDAARRKDSAETSVPAATSSTPEAPNAPLPPPEALTDVLSRLADPAVPGSDKLNLIEGSTPETAPALDRFTNATRDGGYLPMTFAANNIARSAKDPSKVTATIVVTTGNPERREFTFPMDFSSFQGGWQLSRKTAEMLLALSNARSSTPAPPPSAPEPAPNLPPAPQPSPEPGPIPTPTP